MKIVKSIPYFFIFVFIFLGFFAFLSRPINAQTTASPATGFPTYLINDYPVGDNPDLWADHSLDFKYQGADNCSGADCKQGLRIDQTVPDIKVTFTGLKPGDYYICGQKDQEKCLLGADASAAKFTAGSDGKITLTVCGGGVNWVKGSGTDGTDGTLEEKCDGKDYFHEGETYNLGVFQDKAQKNNVITATFFTKHSYPVVKLSPASGTAFSPQTPLKVSLWGRRPGGNNDNNYQLVVEGVDNGFKQVKCVNTLDGSGQTVGIHSQGINLDTNKVIPEHILNGVGWGGVSGTGAPADKTFGKGDSLGLGTGSYVLKINERKGDSRPLGLNSPCEGGHSYIYIYFTIGKNLPNGIQITRVAYDPNNADWEDIESSIVGKSPFPPCAKGAYDEASGTCSALNTALGNIPTTIEGFITAIFRFVLMLAGFGATIIIIYAGYIFMTSRGDKEKIAGARETLTAAIVGLLFIVLSIVILEIIGVDILRLPGLSR